MKKTELLKDIKIYKQKTEEENVKLREFYKKISSSEYYNGIPNLELNRGDKSDLFAFPFNFAKTCKELENSNYLEPILLFYKQTFSTFTYKLKLPKNPTDLDFKIKNFFESQFDYIGGINRFITTLAYTTLVYGFNYFTSNTLVKKATNFGIDKRLYFLESIKYYDPSFTKQFIYDDYDYDLLKAVNIFSANKTVYNYNNVDLLDKIIQGEDIQGKDITIDFEKGLGGYLTYGGSLGDAIGKPFLYSLLSQNQILEDIDESFIKALKNFGEHSYNYSPIRELDDIERQNVYKEVEEFISQKGGVFISKYGKLEKIDTLDGNEWVSLRDSLISHIYKSKGLDFKALGLNRGATRNLAELAQSDSVLQAQEIIKDFLFQLNNNFMKYYFDVNFKYQRLEGLCDYLQLEVEIPESNINNDQVELSSIRGNEDKKGEQINLYDEDNYLASETNYAKNGNIKSRKTIIPLKQRFIKQQEMGNEVLDIIIDTTNLDRVLSKASDEMARYLREEILYSIRDRDFIRNNILHNGKGSKTAIDRKQIELQLKDILYTNVRDMVRLRVDETIRGLGDKRKALEKYTKTTYDDFIDKQTQKFINKSGNRIVRQILDKVENQIRDDIQYYTDSVDIESNTVDTEIDRIQSELYDYKASDIEKITDRYTINAFQDVSNRVIEDVAKTDTLALIRVGVLETACDKCKERMGIVYYKDDYGYWYNPDYPYYKLPDNECYGGLHNCNCYYTLVDYNELENNAKYSTYLRNKRIRR